MREVEESAFRALNFHLTTRFISRRRSPARLHQIPS
jgi:hypothetical protein